MLSLKMSALKDAKEKHSIEHVKKDSTRHFVNFSMREVLDRYVISMLKTYDLSPMILIGNQMV